MKKLILTALLSSLSMMAFSAEEIIVAGDKIDLVKKSSALEVSYVIKSKRTEVIILRAVNSNFRRAITIGCGRPSNAGGGCSGATTAVGLLEIDDSEFRIVKDSQGREFVEYLGRPSLIQGDITAGKITEMPPLSEFRQLGFVQIPERFNACGYSETRLPSFFFQMPTRFRMGLINISEITNNKCSVYK